MKKLFTLIALMCIAFIVRAETIPADSYAGGSGTEDDPYQISNLAELRRLSEVDTSVEAWSKYYILTADINASDAQTWNDSTGFNHIGRHGSRFTGDFDGNYHTIDSLIGENPLFGGVEDAYIHNIFITNASITKEGAYTSFLVVVAAGNSIIEKCGVISSSLIARVSGGIVATNYSSSFDTTNIRKCFIENSTIVGTAYTGGIAGWAYNKGVFIISDCYTNAIVEGNYSAGIVGMAEYGSLTNCYSFGYCAGGGISYYTKVSITNCYALLNNGSRFGTELNLKQFADIESFPAWDFDETWESDFRPFLKWTREGYLFIVNAKAKDHGGILNDDTTQVVFHNSTLDTIIAVPDEDYVFKHWESTNGDIVSINEILSFDVYQDSSLYAHFGKSFTIYFMDYNGAALDTLEVAMSESATAVDDPTRTGYTFTGWDIDYLNITLTSDLFVTAQYTISTYAVSFEDYDGTLLKTDSVDYGSSATAPEDPSRDGYTFSGWNMDFSNITSDTTVTALYTVVAGNTGIENSELTVASVYPNPASSYITIENANGETALIYNIAGMIVKQEILVSENQNIDINDLKQGLYILKIGDYITKLNVIK